MIFDSTVAFSFQQKAKLHDRKFLSIPYGIQNKMGMKIWNEKYELYQLNRWGWLHLISVKYAILLSMNSQFSFSSKITLKARTITILNIIYMSIFLLWKNLESIFRFSLFFYRKKTISIHLSWTWRIIWHDLNERMPFLDYHYGLVYHQIWKKTTKAHLFYFKLNQNWK